MKHTQRWQDWVTLIIGIWVFITPWIFGFNMTSYAWSPFVAGALLVIFSIWELANKRIWEEWINLIIGAWVFISPWVLGFSHTPNAAWIMFVFGAITFIVAIWGMENTGSLTKQSTKITQQTP